MLLSIILIYGRVFKYPFIQDDWYILDSIRSLGCMKYLSGIFSVTDDIFYRPVGKVYFVGIYQIFRFDSMGFHIVALFLHFVNSLLVVYIALEITGDRLISWSTGFLYAVAITVHMDSFLWMVGIYDIGGAFFFFLSFLLFLRGKLSWSAAVYCLAIFTKESTIILLPILFFYKVYEAKNLNPFYQNFKLHATALWRHIITLVLYGIIRIPSIALIPTSNDNPYHFQLTGPHIEENINLFFRWGIEAINPFFEISFYPSLVIFGFIILLILIHYRSKIEPGKAFFLELWMILGLLPVIFLTNHFYRYYLTYSIPSFLILLLYGFRSMIVSLKTNHKIVISTYLIVITTSIISSMIYFAELDKQEFDVPTIPGSGNLIRKGTIVNMVKNYLLSEYPVLSKNTSLVFNWVPTIAFGRSIGPRVWYNDTTIRVYEAVYVRVDSLGMYVEPSTGNDQEINKLDPHKTLLLKFHGDYIRTTDLKDFLDRSPIKHPKIGDDIKK